MSAAEPRIVCVGGGHGLSAALRAARQLTPNVTAIVTVADDGGSSGVLRAQLGIPAPGDLRMAIAALAGDPDRERLLQYRFREGELAGHPLGNLIIAALADVHRDFAQAVGEVAELALVKGRVMPSTTTPVRLAAQINGEQVQGQVSIARGGAAVERLWLEPDAAGFEGAIDALAEAELVVLGPGSMFTSVIAALLPLGIAEAAARAGRVALVLNLSEQNGETLGMDAAAHVATLREHCPALRLDAVLAHETSGDDPALVARPIVIEDDLQALAGVPLLRADLRNERGTHDPDKLAAMLRSLLW